MHMEIKRIPGEESVVITLTSQPIKLLRIEGDYILCEWEGTRQKLLLSEALIAGIMSEDVEDDMRGRFVALLDRIEGKK